MTGRRARRRLGRIAGFTAGLCLLAGLVTLAGTQAAAQFDRSSGPAQSSTVTLTVRQGSTTYLRYDGLMPGEAKTRTIDYSVAAGRSTVDLWIVFDRDSPGYQSFTGARGPDSPRHPSGGLGGYGYFAIADSNGGLAFESADLEFVPGTHNTGVRCTVDPRTGRGGGSDLHRNVPIGRWFPGLGWSSRGPWTYPVSTPPSDRAACGVPGAIRLADGLRTGSTGTISVTVGLDPTFTQQNATLPVVPFTLVAIEHGAPNPCPAPPFLVGTKLPPATSRW